MSIFDYISRNPNELLIFACDYLSQFPEIELMLQRNPFAHAKTARVMPMARQQDCVVLAGKLNQEYYAWLQSLGFGPGHVVAYDQMERPVSLAEMIAENPDPILEVVEKTGKEPVLVPFYSEEGERKAAEALSASLFGAEVELTRKYFNKESFKRECKNLGLPVIEGGTHNMNETEDLNYVELATLVEQLLHQSYPQLSGSSLASSTGIQSSALTKFLSLLLQSFSQCVLG